MDRRLYAPRRWKLVAIGTAWLASIATPAESMMARGESIASRAASITTPAESIVSPAESITTSAKSITTPAESIVTPAASITTSAESITTSAKSNATPAKPPRVHFPDKRDSAGVARDSR